MAIRKLAVLCLLLISGFSALAVNDPYNCQILLQPEEIAPVWEKYPSAAGTTTLHFSKDTPPELKAQLAKLIESANQGLAFHGINVPPEVYIRTDSGISPAASFRYIQGPKDFVLKGPRKILPSIWIHEYGHVVLYEFLVNRFPFITKDVMLFAKNLILNGKELDNVAEDVLWFKKIETVYQELFADLFVEAALDGNGRTTLKFLENNTNLALFAYQSGLDRNFRANRSPLLTDWWKLLPKSCTLYKKALKQRDREEDPEMPFLYPHESTQDARSFIWKYLMQEHQLEKDKWFAIKILRDAIASALDERIQNRELLSRSILNERLIAQIKKQAIRHLYGPQ